MLRRQIDRKDTLLGSLAGSDVLLRTAADIEWTLLIDSINFLADSAVIALALTALARSSGSLAMLAAAAQLALFGYIAYRITPLIFPDGFGPLIRERGFRMVVACAVMASTVSLKRSDVGVAAGILLGVGLFTAYLLLIQNDPFDPEEGHVYGLLVHVLTDAFSGSLVDEQIRKDDLWGRLMKGLSGLAMVGVLAFASFLLGLLSWGIGFFFPLPELLVIGWTVLGPDAIPYADDGGSIDIEESLFATIPAAITRTPTKGLVALPLVGTGVGFTGIWFIFIITIVLTISPTDLLTITTLGLRGLVLVVILTSYVTFSLYGLWFWVRVTRRLPAYLMAFQRTRVPKEALDLDSLDFESPPVARPPGYLIPQFFLVVLPIGFLFSFEQVGYSVPLTVGFLGVWTVVFLVTVRSVLWTLDATPQPPMTETRAIPIGWAIGWTGIIEFLTIENHPQVMMGNNLGEAITFVVPLLATGLLMILIFFYADVWLYFARFDDFRSYGGVGYIMLMIVIIMATGTLSTFQTMSFLAFVTLVVGIFLAIERFA